MKEDFTERDIEMFERGRSSNKNGEHIVPSPETRERLVKVETNQKNLMQEIQEIKVDNKKEHNEIKAMIEKLGCKLDVALDKKAEKSEVAVIKTDLEEVKKWKWKMMGIWAVGIAVIYIIIDFILGKI